MLAVDTLLASSEESFLLDLFPLGVEGDTVLTW
jgi:hypothetical protein